jgi:SAM-dependent methyltransferase
MPDLQWNIASWDGSYDWSTGGGGEEWSHVWGGSEAQWFGSLYPRLHRRLPTGSILEIAPGYGRWTKFLIGACRSYVGVDLSAECIRACESAFSGSAHARFMKNDGLSLHAVQCRFDLIFSFDSLVHAELNVLESYIPQMLERLEESGVAFIHHSNFYVNTDHRTNPHCRATSVSAEKVAGLVAVHGGRVLLQELLNWGRSDPCDCITVFARNGSRCPTSPLVLNNRSFMAEAEIIKNYQSPYAVLGS